MSQTEMHIYLSLSALPHPGYKGWNIEGGEETEDWGEKGRQKEGKKQWKVVSQSEISLLIEIWPRTLFLKN